ncbi:hypothetical protein Barb7_02491 [Bacteroidales bacterium Barb7]|nr:hypothetical protein Barb7_02491 [Bacteroidales bacterium Barb7]
MQFAPFARLAEVRGVGGGRLSRCRTCQQAGVNAQRIEIRYDFLQTDGHDMHLGERSAHIGIPFVGADNDVARFGNGKVAARHAGIGTQELVAKMLPRRACEVGRVAVARLRAQLFLKQLAHFLPFDVNGRHHDMAGGNVHKLYDTLAEVSFHHVNALLNQVLVQVALFGQHGFALHQLLRIVSGKDAVYNLIMLFGILRPMHDHTVSLRLLRKLFGILVQVRDSMQLYLARQFAELFPFGHCHRQPVSLLANEPQRFIVPRSLFLICNEAFRRF